MYVSVCPQMSLWKCLLMYGFKCFSAIDSFHRAANVVLQIVEKAKIILFLFDRVLFSRPVSFNREGQTTSDWPHA